MQVLVAKVKRSLANTELSSEEGLTTEVVNGYIQIGRPQEKMSISRQNIKNRQQVSEL